MMRREGKGYTHVVAGNRIFSGMGKHKERAKHMSRHQRKGKGKVCESEKELSCNQAGREAGRGDSEQKHLNLILYSIVFILHIYLFNIFVWSTFSHTPSPIGNLAALSSTFSHFSSFSYFSISPPCSLLHVLLPPSLLFPPPHLSLSDSRINLISSFLYRFI